MSDEVDLRRVEEIMLLTCHGRDPGPTTFAERVVVTSFVEQMIDNWQATGVLPRTKQPLDLTPTDVLNAYRRWAYLETLRVDPVIPWREGMTLATLLKTCGDRLPTVKSALRLAGIGVPADEWEPPGD